MDIFSALTLIACEGGLHKLLLLSFQVAILSLTSCHAYVSPTLPFISSVCPACVVGTIDVDSKEANKVKLRHQLE